VALVIGGGAFTVTFQLLGSRTREILPGLWSIFLILTSLMALVRGLPGQLIR
jgi:hypothetical protein